MVLFLSIFVERSVCSYDLIKADLEFLFLFSPPTSVFIFYFICTNDISNVLRRVLTFNLEWQLIVPKLLLQ